MTVQAQRLGFGEQGIVSVDVPPAGLNTADLGIGKVGDDQPQKAWLRNKVSIQHGDQLTLGLREPDGQGSGLETGPLWPGDVDHIDPLCTQMLDDALHQRAGPVGRIVEHLDLEPFPRVVQPGHRSQQPLDGVQLVIDWQLNRDLWPLHGRREDGYRVTPMPQVEPDQQQAVESIQAEQ